MPSAQEQKVRENRLRRVAERRGLILSKSRRRDPRATDFGTFMLLNRETSAIVASGSPSGYGLTLDDVEARLTQ